MKGFDRAFGIIAVIGIIAAAMLLVAAGGLI